jgi:hypothetical protein
MNDTMIKTTATICSTDADRLAGWLVDIQLVTHPGERGGTTMLRRGDTTIYVHDADFTVHRNFVPLTEGVATLAEALDLADAAERKAA